MHFLTTLELAVYKKERATNFIMENTGFLEEEAAKTEIDRYITLPAKVIASQVGLREIFLLRKKFTGLGYPVKNFHTAVLKCHGPLYLLESCIRNYRLNEKFPELSAASEDKKSTNHHHNHKNYPETFQFYPWGPFHDHSHNFQKIRILFQKINYKEITIFH